jgi:hypothetical protein
MDFNHSGHGRACPGHPRISNVIPAKAGIQQPPGLCYPGGHRGLLDCPVKPGNDKKTWMPGTSPGMTVQFK